MMITKGAAKVKTILVVIILLLVGVLGVVGMGAVRTYMSGAAASSGPIGVRAEVSADGASTTISFSTDKKSIPVVLYGTGPTNMLLSKAAVEEDTSFNITLTPLKKDTLYYYSIKVGSETYDNAGIPFSFSTAVKTAASEDVAAPPVEDTAVAPVVPATEEVMPTAAAAPVATTECDRTTDYNGDGVVNSIDYMDCTSGKTKAATPTTSTDPCKGVDYNKDGITNAVDEIMCRNSGQKTN